MVEVEGLYEKLARSGAGLLGPAVSSLAGPLPFPIPIGLVVVLALEARKRLKSKSLLSMPTQKAEDALIRIGDEAERTRKEVEQARKNVEDMERGVLKGRMEPARQALSALEGKLEELEDTQTILNLVLVVKRRIGERKSIFGEGVLKKLDKSIDKIQDKKLEEVLYGMKEKELNVREFSEYLHGVIR